VADALRAWVIAEPSARQVSPSDALAAVFLLRTIFTDLLRETEEGNMVADWPVQVAAYLDRMAILTAETFTDTAEQIVTDRLADTLKRERDQLEALYTITREISASRKRHLGSASHPGAR
jgi:hypothetical protein